ncbi:MAG: GGDEF domain-containing protein [Spirochaetota bacterium]
MKLAEILKKRSSEVFFPARFGGEEFVILFPSTSAASAASTIDALRDELTSTSFRQAGSSEIFHISFSAGIAEYPIMASTISELLSRADQALYAAKNDGRGRTYIFRPIMARNDRFWEYLKTRKGTFFEPPFNEPVSKLPYLPQTLEQIINLDYEVRSIGVLIIKLQPLFNLRELRGQRNIEYDIENIKFIIRWACECNFPSDTYLAVTNFFTYEVVALFPSIVDFSYNPEKFKGLCRDISMDFFIFILNYFFDIYFSGDVIYFEKANPRNLLEEIEHIRDRVYLLDNKRDFFVNIFNEVRHALYDSSSLKGVLEIKSFYSFFSMEPSYNYFSSCNFIIKTDFTELLLRESIGGWRRFREIHEALRRILFGRHRLPPPCPVGGRGRARGIHADAGSGASREGNDTDAERERPGVHPGRNAGRPGLRFTGQRLAGNRQLLYRQRHP